MTVIHPGASALDETELAHLRELAAQLRVDSIRSSTEAGSGHPTSSLSAADLLAVLISRHLRYDWRDPEDPANDHLIFSKGHASPLLYSVFKAVGVVSDEELVNTYRRFGSPLQGHPTPVLPWVDVATGALGQGLPVGVGVGLAGQYLDKVPYHVWVLCGDSELAEGSIWEAMDKGGFYRLRNLTAIVDVNRLGQRGPTELQWDLEAYRRRVEAFGWQPILVDGHDLRAIDDAFAQVRQAGGPTAVLARTVKGKGVPEVENKNGWHGKPLPADLAERAVAALGGVRQIRVSGPVPEPASPATPDAPAGPVQLPRYDKGDKVATRKAYGDALVALGARPDVVVLDGEVSNSTHADEFAKAYPDRYFEMFIAEQQMVSAAVGLQVRRYRPFASTFAAFFSRAYDFVRMAAISRADIRLSGSHAGVEIGPDGVGGSGRDARRARLHRAVPERRGVLCRAGGPDGRPARGQLHPHHPGFVPGAVRQRRGLSGGWQQAAARRRPGRHRPGRRRGDPAQLPGRRGSACRAGHPGRRDRPVQRQADRPPDAGRRRAGDRRPDRHRRRPLSRRWPRRGRPRGARR
jgi:transketolase